MKVIVAGPEKVIIEMTTEEFELLTSVRVGDYYGNGGLSPNSLAGVEFDLSNVMKAIFDLKCVYEVKERIKSDLLHVASKMDRLTFPLVSFKDVKAKKEGER